MHGVRHGRMQFEDAHGGTLLDILQLAGVTTECVTRRKLQTPGNADTTECVGHL